MLVAQSETLHTTADFASILKRLRKILDVLAGKEKRRKVKKGKK